MDQSVTELIDRLPSNERFDHFTAQVADRLTQAEAAGDPQPDLAAARALLQEHEGRYGRWPAGDRVRADLALTHVVLAEDTDTAHRLIAAIGSPVIKLAAYEHCHQAGDEWALLEAQAALAEETHPMIRRWISVELAAFTGADQPGYLLRENHRQLVSATAEAISQPADQDLVSLRDAALADQDLSVAGAIAEVIGQRRQDREASEPPATEILEEAVFAAYREPDHAAREIKLIGIRERAMAAGQPAVSGFAAELLWFYRRRLSFGQSARKLAIPVN